MLNAHTDTVGAGGLARPLEPLTEGNRLYGRGAYDMKGSLAAILVVAAEAQRRRWRGDLIVTAVVDEEFASVGTQGIVEGWRADAAIVTEPTGLDVCVAHKGFAWLEVETRGVAAHGSRPDLGVDAIAKMGPVLVGLEALDRELRDGVRHPLLGPASIHASLIGGGQELSTYPEHCRPSIERRTIPGETPATVEAQVRAILTGAAEADQSFEATMRTTLVREPFEVAEDAAIVEIVRRRAEASLGRVPAVVGASGWMDSALLAAAGIPTVVFGPGGEGAHAAVEWVDLDQVGQCVDILLAVAEEWCA
jgi:acetylornithine deacetylase